MDRRRFLTAYRKAAVSRGRTTVADRGLATGLTPYAGPWTRNEVAHLLKRTCFGAPKTDVDYFAGRSTSDAVDELLNVVSVSPPVRDYVNVEEDDILYDDLGVLLGNTWVADNNTASDANARGAINRARVDSLLKWWAGCILNSRRSITEKMVLFWHHHFSVQREEAQDAQFLYKHHALLRGHALGNFKTLVRDVTIDPAMLLHLNGNLNEKRAPDENYGRELQELFTVGTGPDSLYTEEDVFAAARVLTGWRVDKLAIGSRFDADAHDTGSKTFSAFYNNAIISGGTNGLQEVDALVNTILNTQEAAKFICRRLYTWFVYYEIDDATEAAVISPLADILRSNNYQVTPVLAALLKSEHFYDALNQACVIKSPYDFLVGTLREFGVPAPVLTDYQNGYPVFRNLWREAADMQQDLFQPPDVAGWPAYYQEPMFYELWINSNSLPRRANYANNLVANNMLDVRAFAAGLSNPSDPNLLISDSVGVLFRYPLSAANQTFVKRRFLTNNVDNDGLWTAVWNGGNASDITNALKPLYAFLLNLPEYQLC